MKVKSLLSMVLAISFVCLGCAEEPSEKTTVTTALNKPLSYIPKQTNIIFHANLRDLKDTPLGQEFRNKLKSEMEDDEDYEEFVRETGLDPEKDIDELWVFISADARDHDYDKGGVLIRGKFDQERIIDYLKKEKPEEFSQDKYRGYRIYLINHRDKDVFTFLNSDLVVLGEFDWVKEIIDQAEDQKASVLNNSRMRALMRKVPAGSQIWGILDIGNMAERWAEEIRRRSSGFKGTKSLENMESILVAAKVHEKADVLIDGEFSSAEEASLVTDMLNGFKAMAKLAVADDKEAIDMIEGIKIKQQGNSLRITTRFGKNFIEKIEEKKAQFQGLNLGGLKYY